MSSIVMIRTLSGLAPTDDKGRRILRSMEIGQSVVVGIHLKRLYKSLGRWWLLCQLVADNCEEFKSKEMVSDFLKIKAGHCSQIVSKSTGEVYLIADSIAFSRLDEGEFEDVWRRAVKAVCEDIMPSVTDVEIENEIGRLIGYASGGI